MGQPRSHHFHSTIFVDRQTALTAGVMIQGTIIEYWTFLLVLRKILVQ